MPSDSKTITSQSFVHISVPATFASLILLAMVALSEYIGLEEILIPEMAALAIGFLAAPTSLWHIGFLRTLFGTLLCGIAGLCIAAWLPAPLWLQIAAAFCIGQLVCLLSGTGAAPMISLAITPLIFKTPSVVYLLSIAVFVTAIAFLRSVLVGHGLRSADTDGPLRPRAGDFTALACRTVLVALISIPAIRIGALYCIAPPILFAFTGFSRPHCRARIAPISSILFITLSALAGASARTLLCLRLQLPVTLAALLTLLLLFTLIYIFNLYLPTAAAVAFLALLVPESALLLYPLQILIGTTIFMAIAAALFRE